ncbi:MAG: Ig-like domain-containing protein, partial [Candidatus Pacebacteria bacterium]|nr:Ig-like domain-containing protein [Candidatus Paceibacterota bacterium]
QTIFQSASSENTADRRIFTISLGNTVNINSSTIRYGKVGSNQNGGGIYIEGIANINYSDISYNRAPDGSGGGADVRGSLTIQNSTVHHNVAHYMGGGLNRDYYSGSGGTPGASDLLDIINSTISYNQVTQTVAYLEGGGVFYRRGSGSITNSTISYNQIVNGEGTSSHGVGTGDAGCVVQLKNNIIAENILTNCWSGEIGHRSSGGGTFTDNGGNIISKLGYYIDGYTAAATSWVDQANGCASPDGTYILQDGGSTSGQLNTNSTLALNSSLYETMTHAITVGTSISVNNGLTGVNGSISVPSTDQRGASRNGNTDIGAFEYAGIFGPPVVNSLSPTDGATGIAVSANLIITFDETVDVEAGANNDIVIKKVSDNSTVETIDSEDA